MVQYWRLQWPGWSFRMYCCLPLQTVINHKPAGDLSQRAERPFIVPGFPPHSSGLHIGLKKKKKFCCEFVTAQTSILRQLCLWGSPAERGSTHMDAELCGLSGGVGAGGSHPSTTSLFSTISVYCSLCIPT